MFELSIVIPTRNRADALLKSILGIAQSTHVSHEIIVIDGASTDATHGILMLAGSIMSTRLRVIRETTNLGFAAACNRGIAIATGRNVCVLHDDVHPLDGALEAAIDQLDETGEENVVLALPWDDAVESEIAVRRTIGGKSFATTHARGTLLAEFPFARRPTFLALPFDVGLRTSAATMDFSLRAWTSGRTIRMATGSALQSHVEPTWEDLTGRAEREAVIARAGMANAKTGFDPRSPCSIVRRDVRKVA